MSYQSEKRICLGLVTAVAIQHLRGGNYREKACDQNSQEDYILASNAINKTWQTRPTEAFGDIRLIMRRNSQMEFSLYMKN